MPMDPHLYWSYIWVLFIVCFVNKSDCQQAYLNNVQLACAESPSISKGYLCNGPQKLCQSFVTFRSTPPYNTPISIAFLLGSDASSITSINKISSVDEILQSDKLVIVPVSCSCDGSIYQHNAPYSTKAGDEYFLIANNTYQGLTTCQALIGQNYYAPENLGAGVEVAVPLRCACPSVAQASDGVSTLLAYMVTWGDTIQSIRKQFGADEQGMLEANKLSQDSLIFPFTPLLIPVKSQTCSVNSDNFYCHCKNGFLEDGRSSEGLHCKPDRRSFPVKLVTLLGLGIGLGFLSVVLVGWYLYRFLKEKGNRSRKEKLFKQNGGYLLEQRLSSCGGNGERARIFTAEEVQRATDNYNESRFLGQGGFGTVYKGMLPDGTIVAVKRSKAVDQTQIEQFINEVVTLSQINHRHIVKLLGCCLETEAPVLVYEYICNGTLSHHIHREHKQHQPQNQDQEQEVPSLSWETRVRIACEVAGAVAYMHSAASCPIFHRDIKSSNILLDDKFSAKVSDFGTSRSIPNDKTHLTTAIQGTFGYLDPECFQLSQFTDKSDVYSFGVVLLELISGRKPICFDRIEEERNLVAYFTSSALEKQVVQIWDDRVGKEASVEEIEAMTELALRCLRSNGKSRPTMKEVSMELEGLRKSQRCLDLYKVSDEVSLDFFLEMDSESLDSSV